jgi:predicted nuclease of restriction endonuclease-like RecB superfamily
MNCVASRLGISTGVMVENMWNDLEDNLIIEHFFKLSPTELIGWYNLSLVQTLLFNSTHVEFFVKGGLYWKRVLRYLKRLGLMYYLEQRQELAGARKQSDMENNVRSTQNWLSCENNDTGIVCSVSGPLSIFKLTDRYGTSIAKLLPSIISAGSWFIKAWIVRKNFTSGKRIYEFELSADKSPLLLCEPIRDEFKVGNSYQQPVIGNIDNTSNTYYDSKVEENFAKRFIQSVTGWSLIREPDPIVLSNGKALIPDFMFERYGKKIYFEIVGFWTREYLEKKLEKIRDISVTEKTRRPDFLMAVNSDYYATSSNSASIKEKPGISQLSSFIEKNHLIRYKGNDIPLKPILEYLK